MALLGPNGAGKTTFLGAISGQIPLTAGTVEVGGNPLGRNATERLARSGVCMIPEGRSIFPNLTVSENLLMYTFRRPGLRSSQVEEKAFARFPRWWTGASSSPARCRVGSNGCSRWPGP